MVAFNDPGGTFLDFLLARARRNRADARAAARRDRLEFSREGAWTCHAGQDNKYLLEFMTRCTELGPATTYLYGFTLYRG